MGIFSIRYAISRYEYAMASQIAFSDALHVSIGGAEMGGAGDRRLASVARAFMNA
jgi:hypothetical protein